MTRSILVLIALTLLGCLLLCCEEYRDGYGPGGRLNTTDALADITGTWLDVADDGSQTTITLTQSGNVVTGTFFDEKRWIGTITGTVSGGTVRLTHIYSDGYIVQNSATVNGDRMSGTFWSADGTRRGSWTAARLEGTTPSGVDRPADSATESVTVELPFQQVALYYMFDHEETVVIRSQEEWDDYLSQDLVMGAFNPYDDLTDPNCAFAQNMLVAHSFGPVQADFAFQSVEVTTVTVYAERILVNVSVDVRDPPSGGFTMPSFMYEGLGVCIPQSDLPVEVIVSYH